MTSCPIFTGKRCYSVSKNALSPTCRCVVHNHITAAHVAMKNVLLQVLDEGTLQKGRKIQDHIDEKAKL